MNKNPIGVAALVVWLAGCASAPSISELRQDVHSVTFVQYGKQPLVMSFGVVDTASFWATYGSGVAAQTGGGAAWHGLESSGRATTAKRAPTAAETMRYLYNNHPMAHQALTAVMPEFARAWGVAYDAKRLQVIEPNRPFEDQDGYLTGFVPTTDLVLAAWVNNLQLTEKLSLGSALAAGFTLGTNTKKVTAESYLWLRAYRRDPASGRYKRVWGDGCGVLNTQMTVSYPFPEIVQSRDKAKQLWDEAAPKLIENCKLRLQQLVQAR